MSNKQATSDLTKPELDILKALWASDRASAREIYDELSSSYDWAYTTTRTTLERMVKKGLVTKRSFHGIYLYQAALSKPHAFARMVRDFAERVLELDHGAVVSLFARSEALTRAELSELRRLLDEEDLGSDS